GPTHEIIGEHPWSYPPDGPNPNMYQTEHDEFYKALRSGKRIDDGNFVVNSCRMALMGRMAAYTGQDVTWDQVVNSKENLGPDKLEMGNAPPPVIRVPGKTKLI
ncbi:MAG: gfo/Idh/MocA family oxidoreductase, partial [Deltaproteobacteria bacterium]